MKPWVKFAVLVTAIVGTLSWLAIGGISETKTYYKTIAEVSEMGNRAMENRLRVGGDVESGSIVRDGKVVRFVMTQDKLKLNVVYTGTDPLPDTFRDSAQALADGRMRPDGTFEASRIQAKCASKYEGKPQYKVQPTQTTNKASALAGS
jgi:cytochrome c-type biogenesis protein CcmE